MEGREVPTTNCGVIFAALLSWAEWAESTDWLLQLNWLQDGCWLAQPGLAQDPVLNIYQFSDDFELYFNRNLVYMVSKTSIVWLMQEEEDYFSEKIDYIITGRL